MLAAWHKMATDPVGEQAPRPVSAECPPTPSFLSVGQLQRWVGGCDRTRVNLNFAGTSTDQLKNKRRPTAAAVTSDRPLLECGPATTPPRPPPPVTAVKMRARVGGQKIERIPRFARCKGVPFLRPRLDSKTFNPQQSVARQNCRSAKLRRLGKLATK